MSTGETFGGGFQAGTREGDPQKRDYLHGWYKPNPIFVEGFKVDARACPGCLFPDAAPGKWPHLKDARCKLRQHAQMPEHLKGQPTGVVFP